VNCEPFHPYIGRLQADNLFEIEANKKFGVGDLFQPGDFLRPDTRALAVSKNNPVNSSNFYSGEVSGLRIEDIRQLDDGTIEATLDAPEAGQCDERLCADGEGCAPTTCGESTAKSGCSTSNGELVPVALALGLLLLEQRFRRRDQRILRGA